MQLGNVLATCSVVCVFGGQVLQVTSSLGGNVIARKDVLCCTTCAPSALSSQFLLEHVPACKYMYTCIVCQSTGRWCGCEAGAPDAPLGRPAKPQRIYRAPISERKQLPSLC
ncbi:hypothetical protein PR002_g25255 [Phytophthora rubi]|uniref:Secreted protein n=1 Tax=Phytophthora rubi TaxID=129364 RepID=A0A6A3I375_9STRA|nr:hypothetical protein PR002_g25255 [Phytophthora rubi]